MSKTMISFKHLKSILLAACALACLLGFSACESCPHDKATAIATASYPGKNEVNSCRVYADALCKKLAENHIQAWRVWYWRNNLAGPTGHAIVVYKDAGSYWCVDNEFPKPSKCSGTTPKEWAQERDSMWLTGGDSYMPVNWGTGNAIVSVFTVTGEALLSGKAPDQRAITTMLAKNGKQNSRHRSANVSGPAGVIR